MADLAPTAQAVWIRDRLGLARALPTAQWVVLRLPPGPGSSTVLEKPSRYRGEMRSPLAVNYGRQAPP